MNSRHEQLIYLVALRRTASELQRSLPFPGHPRDKLHDAIQQDVDDLRKRANDLQDELYPQAPS